MSVRSLSSVRMFVLPRVGPTGSNKYLSFQLVSRVLKVQIAFDDQNML